MGTRRKFETIFALQARALHIEDVNEIYKRAIVGTVDDYLVTRGPSDPERIKRIKAKAEERRRLRRAKRALIYHGANASLDRVTQRAAA